MFCYIRIDCINEVLLWANDYCLCNYQLIRPILSKEYYILLILNVINAQQLLYSLLISSNLEVIEGKLIVNALVEYDGHIE